MTIVETRPDVAAPPLQPVLDTPPLAGLGHHWLPAADWDTALPQWERLAVRAGPNAFLQPAFALAARLIDPAPGLGAFVLTRDGEWLGLVAGRRRFGGRIFSLWTHPYAHYALPLALPGQEAGLAMALGDWLKGLGAIAIDWPYGDAAAAPYLAAFAARGQRIDAVDAHERAMLRTVQPLAKNHRRLWRRLVEEGEVTTLSTARGLDPDTALAAFLHLEAAGWKGARGTAFAKLPQGEAFVRAAIGGLIRHGRARIDLIALSGHPIAAGVAVMAPGRAWYWKTAYDEAFGRFSPGVLMSHALGTALVDQGLSVDSCAIPGHPMIDRLWPERLAIAHRFIAVESGAGGADYRAALALKRTYLRGRAAAKRLLRR